MHIIIELKSTWSRSTLPSSPLSTCSWGSGPWSYLCPSSMQASSSPSSGWLSSASSATPAPSSSTNPWGKWGSTISTALIPPSCSTTTTRMRAAFSLKKTTRITTTWTSSGSCMGASGSTFPPSVSPSTSYALPSPNASWLVPPWRKFLTMPFKGIQYLNHSIYGWHCFSFVELSSALKVFKILRLCRWSS